MFVHLVFPAPDTVYEFRVQAGTTVGVGPFSTSRSFTTREDGMEMKFQIQCEFD